MGADLLAGGQAHLNWHDATRHVLTVPPTHQGIILHRCPTLHGTWPVHGGRYVLQHH